MREAEYNYYFEETKKYQTPRFPQYVELRLTQQCNLQRFYRDTGFKVIFNTSGTLVLGFYCSFRTYDWQH